VAASAAERGALLALAQGRHGDPFALLGPHDGAAGGCVVRTFAPRATRVTLVVRKDRARIRAAQIDDSGLFEAACAARPADYRWEIHWGRQREVRVDPYAFGPLLGDAELAAFGRGELERPADVLGSQPMTIDGVDGVRFAVWAPNARRVSVVGDFNLWDGRRHPMRRRDPSGVWELFVPGLAAGNAYKYELLDAGLALLPLKADPYARQSQLAPGSSSLVAAPLEVSWHDAAWLGRRAALDPDCAPLTIYEVHALSWQRDDGGDWLDWDALAARLIPYVLELGFTHVELLPIAEYPFGGSWGYQPLGLYAPTARLGTPAAFARFVDSCHAAGIGVIVDWVSAHFPDDAHGLARFDGTALYEHADPREGVHKDWNTLIYNHGRNEVGNYLIGSALEWLGRFHVDGLRVDAVASMLYRDYSRAPGEWVPNALGGRENLEAVDFLRRLNTVVARHAPGAMVIAEESTAWPGVTAPVQQGGLGFSHKWNMGWMHDTLAYLQHDPVHRKYHHDALRFGLVYAYSERFILPLSHDETVHGKGSLLQRMPGTRWQRFANLRAYFGFMWAHPGKKLLFMGGEFAQWREWNHDTALDWFVLDDAAHRGVRQLVGDLNRTLLEQPALHRGDADPQGFRWLVADDSERSVLAFLRLAHDASPVLVVCNFTPLPRHGYRVGVPCRGAWRELVNTDSGWYGGSNLGNGGQVHTDDIAADREAQSLQLLLPPLATLFLRAPTP